MFHVKQRIRGWRLTRYVHKKRPTIEAEREEERYWRQLLESPAPDARPNGRYFLRVAREPR